MQLRGIEVAGFRSLRKSNVHGLTTVSSIVGRNNAGKTALFESLLLLYALRAGDVELEGLQQVLPWDRPVEQVLADSLTDRVETGEMELDLEFVPTPNELEGVLGTEVTAAQSTGVEGVLLRYRLSLAAGRPNRPNHQFVPEATIRLEDKEYGVLKLSNLRNSQATYQVPAEGSLRGALAAGEPRATQYSNLGITIDALLQQGLQGQSQPVVNLLMNWVKSLRFVGRTRQSQGRVDLSTTALLKSDGSNLPRYLQYLLNNEPRKWDQLRTIFQELVPWLRDVFSPISQSETSIRIAVDTEQDAANAFELSNMGAGTTHLMTIIAMVWSAPYGSLCLIDEPEQGLHSSAQRDLALWLGWHAKEQSKQVILATHSTIFASPTSNASVFLATYTPTEGTQFRLVGRDQTAEITAELGVRFADFFAYDYLMLVDGETEFVALPVIAAALGMDFEAMSIRLLPLFGDARARLKRLEDYLSYLQGTQVTPFVVLDSDPGVSGALDDLVSRGLLSETDIWLWKRGGHAGEFEDNLSDAQLVDSANKVARDAGSSALDIRLEELVTLRNAKPKTMTSKLLSELYHRHFQYGLPKVSLAKEIAAIIADDIANGKRDFQVVAALERARESVTAGSRT